MERLLSLRFIVAVPVLVICFCQLILFSYDEKLNSFYDDAFYYMVTAENLFLTGRSTFDGVVWTNGYHPGWFGLILSLVALAGGAKAAYVNLVLLVEGAIGVAFCVLVRRWMGSFAPNASPRLLDGLALIVAVRSSIFFFGGMESALALPFALLLCMETHRHLRAPLSPRRLLLLGLLCSLTALSRLDSAILGGLCGLAVLVRHHSTLPADFRRGLTILAGGTPLLAYLVFQKVTYGSWFTVSAQAKTLPLPPEIPINTHLFDWTTTSQLVAFVIVPLASLGLVAVRPDLWKVTEKWMLAISCAFPILYYFVLSLKSTWVLFPWYFYPLPLTMAVALAMLSEGWAVAVPKWERRMAWPVLGVSLAASGVLAGYFAWRSGHQPHGIADASRRLANFLASTPGYFAMGDRAGYPAFLAGRGFLQVEGLCADQRMIDSIRARRDLKEVLKSYGATHVIDTVRADSLPKGNCFEVVTPHMPLPGPTMRSQFCDPIFRYDSPIDQITTVVFKIE